MATPTEGTPLLQLHSSDWETNALVRVNLTRAQEQKTTRKLQVLALAGLLIFGGSTYAVYRGVKSDGEMGGLAIGLGIVAGGIGALMSIAALGINCNRSRPSQRSICKIAQDQEKAKELSKTLATGEFSEVTNLLRQYPDLTEADLTDYNFVKAESAAGLFVIREVYSRAIQRMTSWHEKIATGVKAIWQELQKTIATEVPFRDIV